MFGVAPAIVQWAQYVAYVYCLGQNASLTLNNNNHKEYGWLLLEIGVHRNIFKESLFKRMR